MSDNIIMRLTKLMALSAKEWQVLLYSLVLLPSIALALRLKGFKWTKGFLQKWTPGASPLSPKSEESLQTAQSVARMVSIAANHGPFRVNCLKRSLTTWWLLQRRGIAVELNIGVNTDTAEFNAHAWVEYMGNTLIDADDVTERYSTFGPQ